MKEELEQEILARLPEEQAQRQDSSAQTGASRLAVSRSQRPEGTCVVAGRMLRGGDGLPECRVKLVRMRRHPAMFGPLDGYVEDSEFVSVTDEDGRCRLEGLPVGEYKVKWQLPEGKGWIRRLRDKPDVIVEEGKMNFVAEIEAHRRLVPQ